MKTRLQRGQPFALAASAALLLGALPFASVHADTTGYLSPTAVGTPQAPAWQRADDITQVNDGVGCIGDATNWATSNQVPDGGQALAVIDLSGVPDGATIDSVNIQVCQTRAVAGSPNAVFQTLATVDGTVTLSGVNADTGDDETVQEVTIQNITLGNTKSAGTVLEVGVAKIGTANATRVFTLAAEIIFTPDGGGGAPVVPSAPPEAIPVMGPLGILFTMLGLGVVGAWQARRKS